MKENERERKKRFWTSASQMGSLSHNLRGKGSQKGTVYDLPSREIEKLRNFEVV